MQYTAAVREMVHRWKTGQLSAVEAMELIDQLGQM